MPRPGFGHRNHVYKETDYECTLHPMRCLARIRGKQCNKLTVFHPLCPKHAEQDMGVEVFLAQVIDGRRICGLRATRTFKQGDLIAPYLGLRCGMKDTRCKHARRVGKKPRPDSPYALNMPDYQLDAACHRSYAAMINHSERANVQTFRLNIQREHILPNDDPRNPGRRRLLLDGYESVPSVLVNCENPKQAGLFCEMAWIVALHKIQKGTEFLLDYGAGAQSINNIKHSTMPSLC